MGAFKDHSAGKSSGSYPAYGASVLNGALISTATKKYGAGSVRFTRALLSYLSFADSALWHLGNTFTIRMWLNFVTHTNDYVPIGQVQDVNNRWIVYFNCAGNYLGFFSIVGGVIKAYYTAVFTPVDGTWYHFQFVRDGANFYIYKDTAPMALTINNAIGVNDLGNLSAPLEIGRQGDGLIGQQCDLYMDDLEMSNIARPASSAQVVPDANTFLYMPFDSDFSDYSGSLVAESRTPTVKAGATDSTVQKYFGKRSCYFDGNNGFVNPLLKAEISYPKSIDWEFGYRDFTIGTWVYVPAVYASPFDQIISQFDEGATRSWYMTISKYLPTSKYQVFFSYKVGGGPPYPMRLGVIDMVMAAGWNYIELGRSISLGSGYISLNGTQLVLNNGNTYNGYMPKLDSPLYVGSYNFDVSTGYTDNVTIDNGILRHNANFAVPTTQYQDNDSYRKLLLTFEKGYKRLVNYRKNLHGR